MKWTQYSGLGRTMLLRESCVPLHRFNDFPRQPGVVTRWFLKNNLVPGLEVFWIDLSDLFRDYLKKGDFYSVCLSFTHFLSSLPLIFLWIA